MLRLWLQEDNQGNRPSDQLEVVQYTRMDSGSSSGFGEVCLPGMDNGVDRIVLERCTCKDDQVLQVNFLLFSVGTGMEGVGGVRMNVRNQILREAIFCTWQIARLLNGSVYMDPADPTYSGQAQTCNCYFLMETKIE